MESAGVATFRQTAGNWATNHPEGIESFSPVLPVKSLRRVLAENRFNPVRVG